jgi:hypothetical protein
MTVNVWPRAMTRPVLVTPDEMITGGGALSITWVPDPASGARRNEDPVRSVLNERLYVLPPSETVSTDPDVVTKPLLLKAHYRISNVLIIQILSRAAPVCRDHLTTCKIKPEAAYCSKI